MMAVMDADIEELLEQVAAGLGSVEMYEPAPPPAKRRGRPKSSDRAIKTLSLPQHMWEWLELWHPGNPSEQAIELLTRAMKMWPGGPQTCPAMKPEKIAQHAAACRAQRNS
jgi:hypothetical protein